jgi:hypothetical protein
MAIDLKKIDDQIRRLQEIKRLASDPEMLTLLEGLVTKNGDVATSITPQAIRTPVGGKNVLLQATRRAIAALPQNRFTSGYLVDQMIKNGFQFAAGKPNVAMNGALKRLVARQEIIIAAVGRGRRATEYDRIPKVAGQVPKGVEPTRHGPSA